MIGVYSNTQFAGVYRMTECCFESTSIKRWRVIKRTMSHHSDGVVEQRFTKHDDVQKLIDVDLLEHGKHGHGIHGRDDGAE